MPTLYKQFSNDLSEFLLIIIIINRCTLVRHEFGTLVLWGSLELNLTYWVSSRKQEIASFRMNQTPPFWEQTTQLTPCINLCNLVL